MGTRFGRRTSDGDFEYHDDKESLEAAKALESSRERAGCFGIIGLIAGGVLAYLLLQKFGMAWPKWLRFALVISGAGVLAFVLVKLADLIWAAFFTMLAASILYWLGSILWNLV